MKFTSLFTSSLLSISTLVSAAHVVDQDKNEVLDKVYVNAYGEIVVPQVFPWGNPALKEKDAAKPRMCGGPVDASGRLGKRTPVREFNLCWACQCWFVRVEEADLLSVLSLNVDLPLWICCGM
jgi:hypothetical protein